METLVNTLLNTPWWVYVLFIVFVSMGVKALEDSTVSLKKLLILPIIFIYWSLHNLSANNLLHGSSLNKFLIFGAVGIVLGYFVYARVLEAYNKKTKRFHTLGSPQTLIIFILIFACKYTFGYLTATDPDIMDNGDFRWVYLILEGVIAGLYVGRLINCLYVLLKGPFQEEV